MSIPQYQKLKTLLSIFLMTVFMLPFQNCGEGFQLEESLSRSSSLSSNDPTDAEENPDNNAVPTLAILFPVQGSSVKGVTIVSGSCQSGLDVSLTINEGALQDTACVGGQFSGAVSLNVSDGPVLIRVEQTDETGKAVAHQVEITKDSRQPQVSISEPLASVTTLTSQTLTVAGACETGLPVRLSGTLLGAPAQADCLNEAYRLNLSTTSVNGSYMLTVTQVDSAGNSGTASRNLALNLPPGAPVVRFTSPAADFATRSGITISGTCTSGLSVVISGSGVLRPSQANCSAGVFQAALTFSTGDGSKNIIISQTNAQNLSGQDSRTFVLDTSAPLVNILTPAAGTSAEAMITISGSCETGRPVSISGSGVSANTTVNCASSMFIANVTFSAGEGTKLVTVSQSDGVGNVGTSSRTFTKIAPALDGQALYSSNCMACHGALSRSSVRNRTALQISNAIKGVGQMKSIVLSPAEIEAISAALRGL